MAAVSFADDPPPVAAAPATRAMIPGACALCPCVSARRWYALDESRSSRVDDDDDGDGDGDDDAGPAQREAVSAPPPLSIAAAASNEIWDGLVARALLPALRGGEDADTAPTSPQVRSIH